MRANGVPDWYIGSCKKIKYMFPKAHAAAYVMSAIRLGWYKVHMPVAFYCAMLTVAPGGFDAEVVSGGKSSVVRKMKDIEKMGRDLFRFLYIENQYLLVHQIYERTQKAYHSSNL